MKIDFSLMKFVYPLLILSLASCKKSNKNEIIDTIDVAKQAFTYGLSPGNFIYHGLQFPFEWIGWVWNQPFNQ